jgi:hypothetical protein
MSSKNIYYGNHRKEFKDADIVLFSGADLVSRIIRWRTKSVYSHAGIVAWWNERLMVLEAVGKGVVARPISYVINNCKDRIDYYRLREEFPATADQRKKMVVFAQRQLGQKFATRRLLTFFFRLLFNMKMTKKEGRKPPGKFFCSQYVSAIYREGGFDLEIKFSDKFTTPCHIAESRLLEFVGTVKKGEA